MVTYKLKQKICQIRRTICVAVTGRGFWIGNKWQSKRVESYGVKSIWKVFQYHKLQQIVSAEHILVRTPTLLHVILCAWTKNLYEDICRSHYILNDLISVNDTHAVTKLSTVLRLIWLYFITLQYCITVCVSIMFICNHNCYVMPDEEI